MCALLSCFCNWSFSFLAVFSVNVIAMILLTFVLFSVMMWIIRLISVVVFFVLVAVLMISVVSRVVVMSSWALGLVSRYVSVMVCFAVF